MTNLFGTPPKLIEAIQSNNKIMEVNEIKVSPLKEDKSVKKSESKAADTSESHSIQPRRHKKNKKKITFQRKYSKN
jgi:3-polyprenyl-4-hydroxybenzoate decarboxylase